MTNQKINAEGPVAFSVILTRDVTESTVVLVRAEDAEHAKSRALALDTAELSWTVDDGNIWQPPYVTDVTAQPNSNLTGSLKTSQSFHDAAERLAEEHETEQDRMCAEYAERMAAEAIKVTAIVTETTVLVPAERPYPLAYPLDVTDAEDDVAILRQVADLRYNELHPGNADDAQDSAKLDEILRGLQLHFVLHGHHHDLSDAREP